MTEFNQWLDSQMYNTAIVILSDSEDITLTIPKEDQVTNEHIERINCNKCPKGYTDMTVLTKTLDFTLNNGTILEASALEFTETEQEILMQLVNNGVIKPRYRRNQKQYLEQLQPNGDYTTDFE